jgi:HJR/Mrr/RecB family endonuclease
MSLDLKHVAFIVIAKRAIRDAQRENEKLNMSLAETLRAAAWYAREEAEGMTASAFGDAAGELALHRQGAMNRFNEAMKNWDDCEAL